MLCNVKRNRSNLFISTGCHVSFSVSAYKIHILSESCLNKCFCIDKREEKFIFLTPLFFPNLHPFFPCLLFYFGDQNYTNKFQISQCMVIQHINLKPVKSLKGNTNQNGGTSVLANLDFRVTFSLSSTNFPSNLLCLLFQEPHTIMKT